MNGDPNKINQKLAEMQRKQKGNDDKGKNSLP